MLGLAAAGLRGAQGIGVLLAGAFAQVLDRPALDRRPVSATTERAAVLAPVSYIPVTLISPRGGGAPWRTAISECSLPTRERIRFGSTGSEGSPDPVAQPER
jgi:hypothetical protein